MQPAKADPAAKAKEAAARRACEFVQSGTVVGLGTGSTANHAIRRLGELVREGALDIQGVPTSEASADLARVAGIPLLDLEEAGTIDATLDGADEVDPALDLVKGLGGALLREKIVAAASKRFVVMVDEAKLVPRLGTKAPVPVEVLRFGWVQASWKLRALGCDPVLRRVKEAPFSTDNGNWILDCRFPPIDDAAALERRIDAVPGVVDNGLFVNLATDVVVGNADGTASVQSRKR
ncbi:MAG TPA: ribose-5-phosphate isomerase RpiA [Candidatus Thermoplasmatota archaeon]|nr:ribose-5-phosphate isomerase RpiA [Candidatus Thermoplasmatota archaeon]